MVLIKTSKDALLGPLQAVVGVVEKRHTLAILANVLIERKADELVFLATDIEMQVTTRLPVAADPTITGALTVAAKKLVDVLRSLPDGAEISLVQDEGRLIVRSGRSRFNLQTLPAADFPRMSFNEGERRQLSVSQKAFRHLLNQTQFAMASQDVRYYLNGLLLVMEGSELRAIATDGHRLSFSSMVLDGVDLPHTDFIVPRKTITELYRLLGDTDEPLQIDFGGNQLGFSFGSVLLISKLIDGRFPDYERVIPTELPHCLLVGRTLLQGALSRAAILCNEKFRGVHIVLNHNRMMINAANAEHEQADEEIEVAYSGPDIDVGFNVNYLLDVLNHCSSEEIEWNFNNATSSTLITVPGEDCFKYVVMPMRI